jgi:hypothetical protein
MNIAERHLMVIALISISALIVAYAALPGLAEGVQLLWNTFDERARMAYRWEMGCVVVAVRVALHAAGSALGVCGLVFVYRKFSKGLARDQ